MHQAWDSRINRYVRYVHPIKTAGTSISNWMDDQYGEVTTWAHQPWDCVPAPLDSTFAFTVFRNPWDRMEGMYFEIGRVLKQRTLPITQEQWDKGFEYFVELFKDVTDTAHLEFTNPHGLVIKAWRSQLTYWPTDYPFHVLNFDNLNDDWINMWKTFDIAADILPHKRHHPHPVSLHTARTRSVIETIWEDDLEYFESGHNRYLIEK